MTWRVGITHTTEYRYAKPVRSSYNEARLEPRSDRNQTVLSSRVEVSPQARLGRHVDYWGTVVHHFDLQVPHTTLTVIGRAVVETATAPIPTGSATWNDLAGLDVTERFHELLAPTRAVTADDRILSAGSDLRDLCEHPRDAVLGAAAWVHERLAYEPGATGVQTTAAEVIDKGEGVCQDFAHVTLAVLRSAGIPAWYVSGYLHPSPDAEVGEAVIGESHAWVAAWVGDVVPVDPTSLAAVAERHVRVAAGRDYMDVAPFRGVFAGVADQELSVEVEVTRLA